MLLLATVALASQAYLAIPHSEPHPEWPHMAVTVTETWSIFRAECNEGIGKATRWLGIGADACAKTNLLTRTCDVTVSKNPLTTMFLMGVPGLNHLLHAHELAHCEGHDHPMPGMLSLSERTDRWVKMGKPYVSKDEWREIEALIEATGGIESAEVVAEVAKRMPRWIEQGQAFEAEVAAEKAEVPAEPAVSD